MTSLINQLDIFRLFIFDAPAMIAGSLVLFVTVITIGFARRYVAGDREYSRILFNMLLTGTCAFAAVFSNHVLALFVFWCLANLLLVRLMIHKIAWQAARVAGLLALSTFTVGFIALAGGLYLLSQSSGSFYLSDIVRDHKTALSLEGQTALALIMITAFVQSAACPFHRWLLSSLNSPTPVSAVMHAGLVNGGGILLIRFASLYLNNALILKVLFAVGLLSAVIGSFWKLIQTDVKRMLACSTMGQMGFMLMQCGMGLFAAALSHLVWHGLFKAYLFLNAGSVVGEKREKDQFSRISTAKFFSACLMGCVGAFGFNYAADISFTAADTTFFMTAMAYMVSTQIAVRVLTDAKGFIAAPMAVLVSLVTGALYGGNIRLIEILTANQSLFTPQPLDAFYLSALAVLIILWLAMNLNLLARAEKSDIWKYFYVRALNASQPHPATVTAFRATYKY